MIYRVRMTISYIDQYFDFDSLEEAAKFVETILKHNSPKSEKEMRVIVMVEDKEEEKCSE